MRTTTPPRKILIKRRRRRRRRLDLLASLLRSGWSARTHTHTHTRRWEAARPRRYRTYSSFVRTSEQYGAVRERGEHHDNRLSLRRCRPPAASVRPGVKPGAAPAYPTPGTPIYRVRCTTISTTSSTMVSRIFDFFTSRGWIFNDNPEFITLGAAAALIDANWILTRRTLFPATFSNFCVRLFATKALDVRESIGLKN